MSEVSNSDLGLPERVVEHSNASGAPNEADNAVVPTLYLVEISRTAAREPAVRRDRAEITHPSGRHHAVMAALKTRRPAPLGIRNARDHRKRPRGAPASALSVQPFVQPPQVVRPPNPGSELRADRATERRQKRLAMNPICSDTSGTRSLRL